MNNKKLQESAFKAINSSIFVSYYYSGGPAMQGRLKGKIEKARTAKANLGRSRPDIDEIIERKSRDLWKCKPKFNGNCEGTAKNIYDAVRAEISKLPEVPKQWKFTNPDDPKTKKRAIQAIAKRVSRILQADE